MLAQTALSNRPPSTGRAAPALEEPGLRQQTAYTILKIAPTSFFADYGCHVRIYEESLLLQALGHRVVICTYHTGGNVPELEVCRAMNMPWRKSVHVGSSGHKLYYDPLLALTALRTAIDIRPDVIHAHLHEGALIGGMISRLLRIPLVFDFQGSLTSEMLDHHFLHSESRLLGPLRWLEEEIDRQADVIITSSRNAAQVLSRDFGFAPGRVVTLADRVNTEVFRPRWEPEAREAADSLRWRLGIPDGRKVVVYLGLLAEYQGTRLLLEAAARLVRRGLLVHFLIMGFPGVDTYRQVASELGIERRVVFTGRVPYREAPRYLAIGDVAVSPKVSETEGNGKLLNYMAVGLPTVTFNTPVAREILGNLGVYADTGDPDSLADQMESLLRNEPATEALGRALRDRAVSQFAWSAAGPQLMEIYAEARSRRVPRARSDRDAQPTAGATKPATEPVVRAHQRPLVEVGCALCGAGRQQADAFLDRFGFTLVRCRHCRLVYVSPRWVEQALLERTDANYFFQEYLPSFGLGERFDPRRNLAHQRTWLDLLARYTSPGRLLDVGCAMGLFARAAQDAGWSAVGVDIVPVAAAYARQIGVKALAGSGDLLSLRSASFDVATMWATIAHLRNPRATLEEIHRVLQPGGLLAISTPNLDSLSFRILGGEWWTIGPRDHLYFFTPSTLRELLRRSGFEAVDAFTFGVSYVNLPHRASRFQRLALRLASHSRLGTWIGRHCLGDHLVVVARKV